jgi:hypothetical protein
VRQGVVKNLLALLSEKDGPDFLRRGVKVGRVPALKLGLVRQGVAHGLVGVLANQKFVQGVGALQTRRAQNAMQRGVGPRRRENRRRRDGGHRARPRSLLSVEYPVCSADAPF